MTMPKPNGPALEIAHHSLGPALQLLREKKPQAELVDVYLGQMLQRVRDWSESRTEIRSVWTFPGTHLSFEETENVSGFVEKPPVLHLSSEEAKDVYGAFDASFRAVFPAMGGLTREQMSGFVLMLARESASELKRPGACTSTKQSLYSFLKVCRDRLEEVEDHHMCAA